jgi:hypothetical protein
MKFSVSLEYAFHLSVTHYELLEGTLNHIAPLLLTYSVGPTTISYSMMLYTCNNLPLICHINSDQSEINFRKQIINSIQQSISIMTTPTMKVDFIIIIIIIIIITET